MAKIQLNIEDGVNAILEKLSRRTDKALFIEIAIKKAYQNPEIRELFSWVEESGSPELKPAKGKSKKAKDQEEPKPKPKFDPDF